MFFIYQLQQSGYIIKAIKPKTNYEQKVINKRKMKVKYAESEDSGVGK